jgi:predicted nucleic acid-binding protein
MRICIDSCVFIHGLGDKEPAAARLLDRISPELALVIPRLVAQEVTRNLTTPEQVRRFYRLFHNRAFAFIVDELVPRPLVDKYASFGLPEKADAFIGAFAEWMQVRYLISDNRHFLRELKTQAFDVINAEEFIARWAEDIR